MKYRLYLPVLGCLVALLGSCTPDRKFQPGTDYPEWAFDKPTYQRPAQEPVPYIKGTNGLPDVYHSNQQVIFIKRPDRPDLRNAPRPALFSTKDNGQSWKREGHFGLGEPYFALRVPQDGTYGICIIGVHRPDVAPPNLRIQQVQVIDSTAPRVEVSILPEETPYWVGQQIRLTWRITDVHATTTPGKLYSKVVDGDLPTPWELLKTGLASNGTARITIQQIPQRAQGVIYRVEAIDEMGKIGAGHSKMLKVLQSAPSTQVRESRSTTFVTPRSQKPPKASAKPVVRTVRKTAPKKAAPLSAQYKAPAKRSVSPIVTRVSSEDRARTKQVSAKSEIQPKAATQKDAEMAELEELLSGISSPVFQGKVYRSREVKAAPSEPKIVRASTPLTKAAPVAIKPSVKIVKIERVQKKAPEAVVDKGATEPAGPIVTVRPPSEGQPEPVVKVVPAAKPVKSAVKPTPIVTVKPTRPATTVGTSSGRKRIAKPWERLGDRANAARDFSKQAPSLSNY